MKISKRIQQLKASPTIAISSLAKEMKRKGVDVINLSAGEPDFPTPENIKNAAVEALRKNYTYYTVAAGIPELKEAICRKFQRENNLTYSPDQIIVSAGAKQLTYMAAQVALDPGDEVLIPAPYWVSYSDQVEIAEGKPIIFNATAEQGFKVTVADLEKHTSANTRMLIINSPCNPTGALYSADELREIAEFCLKHDIFIMSDEVYEHLVYDDEKFVSVATFSDAIKEITLTVNGVSKSYSMTGWRVGYAAGPIDIIKGLSKLQTQINTHATSIAQWASIEALDNSYEKTMEMKKEFDERRKFIVSRLQSMPGIETNIPKGAFYVFPIVSDYYGSTANGNPINNSVDFCKFMLEEMKIAMVPGVGFGDDNGIRISYASSMKNIKNAMDRFEEGLKRMKK